MDSELRDPRTGQMMSNYDGSHLSTAARDALGKFSDEIADKIRAKANSPPAVKQERSSAWVPWNPVS